MTTIGHLKKSFQLSWANCLGKGNCFATDAVDHLSLRMQHSSRMQSCFLLNGQNYSSGGVCPAACKSNCEHVRQSARMDARTMWADNGSRIKQAQGSQSGMDARTASFVRAGCGSASLFELFVQKSDSSSDAWGDIQSLDSSSSSSISAAGRSCFQRFRRLIHHAETSTSLLNLWMRTSCSCLCCSWRSCLAIL